MPKRQKSGDNLPRTFQQFTKKFPDIATAHEEIARSIDGLGPLDRKTCALIKLGISIGAGLETATKSHARRALQAGASLAEIEQAILLTVNTCGFPRTVAAWRWTLDAVEASRSHSMVKRMSKRS
ncbi:MAG: carboxymuconolactone decarboxylase family protein [Planctomycetes bacterium]|nr:carboxymuconolactone decarboxylase family protein [Planctomycetota bacterium]MBI3834856.1 carboxymuconolactone decarboxylase family protein [Planctomycetota bacterium]